MYNLSEYVEKDPAEVLSFMQQHPLATLIGNDAGRASCSNTGAVTDQCGKAIRFPCWGPYHAAQTSHHKVFGTEPACTGALHESTYLCEPQLVQQSPFRWHLNYMITGAQEVMEFTDEATPIGILRNTQNLFRERSCFAFRV